MTAMKESELVRALTQYFQRDGYDVYLEVSNMGTSVDLVAEKDGKVIAVEAKVRDWKRAMEQCKHHFLVADYVAIAMGPIRITEYFAKEAIDRLLTVYTYRRGSNYYGTNWHWIRHNNLIQSTQIWQPQREIFLRQMHEIKKEDIIERTDNKN